MEKADPDGRNKMVFLLLWSDQGIVADGVFSPEVSVWDGKETWNHVIMFLATCRDIETKLLKHDLYTVTVTIHKPIIISIRNHSAMLDLIGLLRVSTEVCDLCLAHPQGS